VLEQRQSSWRHLSVHAGLSLIASMARSTLDRERQARGTTLAAAVGIGQTAMTELVQRLERQDLLTGVGTPETGGRPW
jgi:hypothetical protein